MAKKTYRCENCGKFFNPEKTENGCGTYCSTACCYDQYMNSEIACECGADVAAAEYACPCH